MESFTVRKISLWRGRRARLPGAFPVDRLDQGRAPRQGPSREALLPARSPRQVGPHRRAPGPRREGLSLPRSVTSGTGPRAPFCVAAPLPQPPPKQSLGESGARAHDARSRRPAPPRRLPCRSSPASSACRRTARPVSRRPDAPRLPRPARRPTVRIASRPPPDPSGSGAPLVPRPGAKGCPHGHDHPHRPAAASARNGAPPKHSSTPSPRPPPRPRARRPDRRRRPHRRLPGLRQPAAHRPGALAPALGPRRRA